MFCLNLVRDASASGGLLCTSRPNWSSADVGVSATAWPLAVAAAGLLRGSMMRLTLCTCGLPRLAARRMRRPHCSCSERQRTASAGSYDEQTLQTRGLCDWKCIFLQWIIGAIFLKCEYPKKFSKINGLEAAIPCNRAGV